MQITECCKAESEKMARFLFELEDADIPVFALEARCCKCGTCLRVEITGEEKITASIAKDVKACHEN